MKKDNSSHHSHLVGQGCTPQEPDPQGGCLRAFQGVFKVAFSP